MLNIQSPKSHACFFFFFPFDYSDDNNDDHENSNDISYYTMFSFKTIRKTQNSILM